MPDLLRTAVFYAIQTAIGGCGGIELSLGSGGEREHLALRSGPDERRPAVRGNPENLAAVARGAVNRAVRGGGDAPDGGLIQRGCPAHGWSRLEAAVGIERKSGQAALEQFVETAQLPGSTGSAVCG